MTGEVWAAIGVTFIAVWAMFSVLVMLADTDWLEAIVSGFVITLLLGFIAVVVLGLLEVWMWAL